MRSMTVGGCVIDGVGEHWCCMGRRLTMAYLLAGCVIGEWEQCCCMGRRLTIQERIEEAGLPK